MTENGAHKELICTGILITERAFRTIEFSIKSEDNRVLTKETL